VLIGPSDAIAGQSEPDFRYNAASELSFGATFRCLGRAELLLQPVLRERQTERECAGESSVESLQVKGWKAGKPEQDGAGS
jgi:hypothetical protein